MIKAAWNTKPIQSFSDLASSGRIRFKDRRHHPLCQSYWPECLAIDRMSRDELLAFQDGRLQELIAHAASHVPFYREWASGSGYRPGDRVEIEDLPVVTKADYRVDIERFQSDAFPLAEMWGKHTSGSSGEPFRFRSHVKAADYSYCCLWRALHRFSLRPGDRRVYLWGRSYSFNASRLAVAKQRAKLKVRDWFNNTLAVDAYGLTFDNVRDLIDRIRRFEPDYLHGYVSALYTIARTLRDRGETLGVPGLHAVVTESEKLYDFQRDTMEEAFGCPILEHYGSVELGNVAEPDPDGNMRINEDLYVVERAATGEAVITNLLSQAYPFIRYKLGDLIEIDPQIAPRLPYASFKSIVGRTVDMIPIPAGGHVHGVALAHAIDPHLAHVLKYQIHQTALDHFVVRLIPKATLPPEVASRIRADLRGLVGPDAGVEVVSVQHIPPAASGKFRWVISDLTAGSVKSPHEEVPVGPVDDSDLRPSPPA